MCCFHVLGNGCFFFFSICAPTFRLDGKTTPKHPVFLLHHVPPHCLRHLRTLVSSLVGIRHLKSAPDFFIINFYLFNFFAAKLCRCRKQTRAFSRFQHHGQRSSPLQYLWSSLHASHCLPHRLTVNGQPSVLDLQARNKRWAVILAPLT